MGKRFSDEELSKLRNDIPCRFVIERLLKLPVKRDTDGIYRFLCPACEQFQTSLHPEENLARCFRCDRNFNPIELVMAGEGIRFVEAVYKLKKLLEKKKVVARDPGQQRREGSPQAKSDALEPASEILADILLRAQRR